MILKPTTYPMKPPPGAKLITGHLLAKGLVGCWTMSENSGLKIFDSSRYGNTGTFAAGAASPIWVTGKYGPCLNFDGDDHIIVPDSPSLDCVGTGLSIVAWITEVAGNYDYFVSKNGITAGGYSVGKRDADEFIFWVYTTGGGSVSSTPVHVFGTGWVHVVATFDGAWMKMYVNGVHILPDTANAGSIPAGADDLFIGAYNDGTPASNQWLGQIDDVSIYNRALSASEIQQLFYDPFCMFARRGWPVGFDTGAVPPAAESVFGSLLTEAMYIKYKKGMYSEI